ncbi:hypothetical protein N7520_003863 [Penicillium odoratum]|uniref:uncharacterized protein n=1 Tax=Penicillium odoratum TaxID=1167516 RepID=UPI00254726C5|nr:uncharacterized protein N7520_003863 [Penicillium odoratum]KAJ5769304.1 hypothetical protein N7520_003863 [Penicillium odoratum]
MGFCWPEDQLHYIYARPDIKEIHGNPRKVLAAIDEYHNKSNKLMNVGAEKGQHMPSFMIELGVYVGYSAILFGDTVTSHGGKQYLGIEKNPEMGAIVNQLVDLAGPRDTVRIIVGSSDEVLQELVEDEQLEEMDVLKPDVSVEIADNVIFPGAPRYRTWVEATTKQKREMVKGAGNGAVMPNPDLVYEIVLTEFETDIG